MKTESNTVLITGGASGIGYALAERFLDAGNTVLICGRREDRLKEAHAKHPKLIIHACDVADPEDRQKLVAWATREFPAVNVLVNNAGIQQRIGLASSPALQTLRDELNVNLEAPIHLSTLFIPHFLKQKQASIVNITSGLSFTPLAMVPIYSATKAALHSFTLSLRHQLKGTPVSVIEIIPPAVDTDLGGVGLHKFGAPIKEFTDSIWEQLRDGAEEAAYGMAAEASWASRDQLDTIFENMNKPR